MDFEKLLDDGGRHPSLHEFSTIREVAFRDAEECERAAGAGTPGDPLLAG